MAEDKQKPTGVQRDQLDQFLTQKRSDVVSNLIELSRTIEPLTVFFDSGKQSFPTSVISLISADTEVVFERASNEDMNRKLLSQKKGTVTGQPAGIKVRFILEQIYEAEYEGDKVFVAPLPSEHYRMQRRRLFRINTQLSNPVKVSFTPPDDEEVTFTVGNISGGGLRLDDVDNVLKWQAGQMLTACTIQIPGVEPFSVDLEVRHFYEKAKKNGNSVQYVGCRFKNLRANHERDIQSYINDQQRAQSAIAK